MPKRRINLTKKEIFDALDKHGGNMTKAAKSLNINTNNLRKELDDPKKVSQVYSTIRALKRLNTLYETGSLEEATKAHNVSVRTIINILKKYNIKSREDLEKFIIREKPIGNSSNNSSKDLNLRFPSGLKVFSVEDIKALNNKETQRSDHLLDRNSSKLKRYRERLAKIRKMYFAKDSYGYPKYGLKEIGEELGISESRISQIVSSFPTKNIDLKTGRKRKKITNWSKGKYLDLLKILLNREIEHNGQKRYLTFDEIFNIFKEKGYKGKKLSLYGAMIRYGLKRDERKINFKKELIERDITHDYEKMEILFNDKLSFIRHHLINNSPYEDLEFNIEEFREYMLERYTDEIIEKNLKYKINIRNRVIDFIRYKYGRNRDGKKKAKSIAVPFDEKKIAHSDPNSQRLGRRVGVPKKNE